MTEPTNPAACILIIGNEVLSGRTQDVNIKFLATKLGELGIPVREVRVIPDIESTIVGTVNEARARFDYVFTTGGIGPTHDDITSECIAKAFGVAWVPHPVAWERMAAHYTRQGSDFNPARQRMATMPEGAELIDNPISIAPGFRMANVFVMAGVPRVMQAMFETVAPLLKGGPPVMSRAVHTERVAEGTLAEGLGQIQKSYPDLDIGSYPYYRATGSGVAIVAKGMDGDRAERAIAEVSDLLRSLGGAPVPGEPPVA